MSAHKSLSPARSPLRLRRRVAVGVVFISFGFHLSPPPPTTTTTTTPLTSLRVLFRFSFSAALFKYHVRGERPQSCILTPGSAISTHHLFALFRPLDELWGLWDPYQSIPRVWIGYICDSHICMYPLIIPPWGVTSGHYRGVSSGHYWNVNNIYICAQNSLYPL